MSDAPENPVTGPTEPLDPTKIDLNAETGAPEDDDADPDTIYVDPATDQGGA